MQDVEPWPDSFDVSQPVARVLVDGREVDVESVSVTSELDSAMPERVAAGGGGVVAATGSASLVRDQSVSEAGFNPWGDARQFVEASEVVVEAGYRDRDTGDVGCARQITAQIESLDGGATENSVGIEFVDATPSLDRDITIPPLLEEYPSLRDHGPRRAAGLSPLYVTNRVLRHCGFYATPPAIGQALLSVPLMGSAVPERGIMLATNRESHVRLPAVFRPVPWGVGLSNGTISYQPVMGSRGHARLTETLHVSFLRAQLPSHPYRNGTIDLQWGSLDDAIRIELFANGSLLVRYREDGVGRIVAAMGADDVNASEAFTVLITPAGEATIYASNGATATGTAALPARAVSHNMDEIVVRVRNESHPIGGLQVAFSTARYDRFQRTAHLDPPASDHSLAAFPAQIKVNCLALLKQQAEAELAAMWVDEFGHFRWRNRHQLRDLEPRGTLTSKHDLLDLPWQLPIRSVFSQVEVDHETPTVTRRNIPSITVSDSRGSSLSNGDTESRFFEPPADQDWHQLETPVWMGASPDLTNIRRGRGSYRGGVIVDDDDNERLAYSSRLHQTWEQINPQRWLLYSEAINLASTESIEQSFLDRPDWYGRFAEDHLPIIRAKGLVEWETKTLTGAARGPRLAPVYSHPVGPWVQDTTELQALADWLADYLTAPDVVLRDIAIVPDPCIQLGDVFWLEDTTAYQVRLKIVVMGKNLTYQTTNGGVEMSQTITCRVIDLYRLKVDYTELEAAWDGRDYEAFESAWSGQDYEALESDPLERN